MTKTIFLSLLAVSSFGVAAVNDEAIHLFKQEKFETAVDEFKPAKPQSFEDFEFLVNTYLALDVDDAEDLAIEMVSAIPDNHKARVLYASVMGAQASNGIFGALGYAKKAKASLQKAVELAPDNVDAISALMGFYMAAPSIAGGDDDEALRLAKSIGKIDEKEGQFAMARYYMSIDEFESAQSVLDVLAEDEESKIRAMYGLAQVYQQKEEMEKAFLQYKDIAGFEPSIAQDSTDTAYERTLRRLLMAKYTVGRLAIDMPSHSNEGVAALKQYIDEYKVTTIDVYGMPSLSWARLRLIELLMNTGEIEQARALVPVLNDLDEDQFKKTRKKLMKRLKKA